MSSPALPAQYVEEIFALYGPHQERVRFDVGALLQQRFGAHLRMKQDTFVSNDGNSELMMCLEGTIPITFQAVTYHIPVKIWVPRTYPFGQPLCYVTPTADMEIHRHPHVDMAGLCYLPYLHQWRPEFSTLSGVVQELATVFGREPPVYSKPKSAKPPDGAAGGRQPAPPHSQPQPAPNGHTYAQMPSGRSASFSLPPNSPPDLKGLSVAPSSQSARTLPTPPSAAAAASTPAASPDAAHRTTSPSTHPAKYARQSVEEDELSRRAALTQELSEKISENIRLAPSFDRYAEAEALFRRNAQMIDEAVAFLRQQKAQLEQNLGILEVKDAELTQLLQEEERRPVNPDEAVQPADPLSQQLYDLVAEDLAIEDAMYHLNKGFYDGRVDLDAYLKTTRELSREQFTKRALAAKVSHVQLQQLPQRFGSSSAAAFFPASAASLSSSSMSPPSSLPAAQMPWSSAPAVVYPSPMTL